MTASFSEFRHRAGIAVEDARLQRSLEGATGRFRLSRENALHEFPGADDLRDHFKAIRSATLARLSQHLEFFEENALAAGSQVHWARDAQEACRIVIQIAEKRGVKLVTKSKSMATEEIHLNQALLERGIDPVETDLGEWIIQLAGEPPSHIIAPAIHKSREQVAELFTLETGHPQSADDIPALTAAARRVLREKFLQAGMGISGVNIGVAETGSVVLVTNEGNGRMVTSAPPIHVAVMGIEKVTPTWEDAAVWLSLLARSATGQPLSVYTSVITGPARAEDPDGPEEVHIVLLDNGRSDYGGTPYEEALQCIRCGACLNVCPVYREAGGHAYGSPYSGPIGAVVTPMLFGLEQYGALPHASTLCGACLDVCPARINLPRMLIELRQEEVDKKLLPLKDRIGEPIAAFLLADQRMTRIASRILRWLQRPFIVNRELQLPSQFNPAGKRSLPPLAERSFREIWEDLAEK